MTEQTHIIKFSSSHTDKVLSELAGVDNELKTFFKNYLHTEYKGDKNKRLDYVDIGEIARFIVDKVKVGQTEIFKPFFDNIEAVLNNCDTYVDNLIVVGLFESIQNICGTSADYHYVFNPWLGQLSKTKWDSLIDNWEGVEWREKYKNISQAGLV